jgi:hypothetical protein
MSKEKLQARVLVGTTILGVEVKANDLIVASKDLIDQYKKNGTLDTSDAAIDYCIKNDVEAINIEQDEVITEVTDQMIVEAIKTLDQDDDELWTNAGKPQCDAIAAAIGDGVTIKAADRDAAWAIIQDEDDGEGSGV